MKFVTSYSGGKESALALHKAVLQGHEPVALITTYNTDAGRSHFHGLPAELLEDAAQSLNVPLHLIQTSNAQYAADFEAALTHFKEQGAAACVFGDIDIVGHLQWCTERCNAVGLEAIFPLLGRNRRDVVYDLINSGFVANITIVDTSRCSDEFLGRVLTADVAERIAAAGADICGENGEYHTFVSDGPIFGRPVQFRYGAKLQQDNYAILPVYTHLEV